MRIAMIGQKGAPTLYGGVERHVEELSRKLVHLNHEVFVYARRWYTPYVATALPFKLIITPSIFTKHFDTITHTFTSTIHAIFSGVDVIHYHGVGPALLAWIPRIFAPKTKVLVTFHCIDRYHQKWGVFARLVLLIGEWAACTFPHETISVSKTIQAYCLNEYKKHTTLVPNGARIVSGTGSALLAQWQLQPEKYVVMISRLIPHKGAHYLVDAWKKFKAAHPQMAAEYKLAVVGGSSFTDAYVADLKAQAAEYSDIIFTGWQHSQALDELYANAALLVHPSENEGLPITVIQAMSFGRPVLVSNIPEHQEVVTDARFWFENTNSDSIAERMASLLSDTSLLVEAGKKNKAHVQETYNWTTIAEKVALVYARQDMASKVGVSVAAAVRE